MGREVDPRNLNKLPCNHIYQGQAPALRHEQQASSVSHDIDIGGDFVYLAGM